FDPCLRRSGAGGDGKRGWLFSWRPCLGHYGKTGWWLCVAGCRRSRGFRSIDRCVDHTSARLVRQAGNGEGMNPMKLLGNLLTNFWTLVVLAFALAIGASFADTGTVQMW